MGFWEKNSQNPMIPYFCTGTLNFTIFVSAHVIITSQKPNPGDDGTSFGINV